MAVDKENLKSNLKGLAKEQNSKKTLNDIAAMLERKGIDPSEVGSIQKVSLYQSVTKNPDTGEAIVHDLQAI